MKATAGPLKVFKNRDGGFSIQPESSYLLNPIGGAKSEADARLWALAPEMLEALTALLSYCNANNVEFTEGWGWSVLNRTKAVLEKATPTPF